MHSAQDRANSIFTFSIGFLAILTFCLFISTFFLEYRINAPIKTPKVSLQIAEDYGNSRKVSDLAHLTFDLETNLAELFNWNVKQLFLFLIAEYKTSTHVLNQVVLWDKIVQRGEDVKIVLKNSNTKYYFWDDGNGLKKNPNVTFYLASNIIPNAGWLQTVQSIAKHSVSFPSAYIM